MSTETPCASFVIASEAKQSRACGARLPRALRALAMTSSVIRVARRASRPLRAADDGVPHVVGGSCDEDHYAAPGSRLTHAYLGGYTSINSQQVIDP
jgi:hypothetical protein